MRFDPLAFISAKKSGAAHRPEEIASFVEGMVAGEIPDYQTAAWLMAVCFQGLSFKETLALTHAITASGKVYIWDSEGPTVVDKHSTGGVGDTVTLVVAPLVAALGMRIGKHSGRGLGHTGGTVDKLESIPGFRTSLTEREFRAIVDSVGCSVCGQDEAMTPADGLLYALRDVTATVNQEALIASSIMSKKLAGGASNIILDIKVGSGAFMKSKEAAQSLARLMIRVGRESGRKVSAVSSAMDAPLGRAIGNALEVAEAIRILKNKAPDDDPLVRLSIEIAARLASMSGLGTLKAAGSRAGTLLSGGAALERFREMIKRQGGDERVVADPSGVLPRAERVLRLEGDRDGFVSRCDALVIGELVRDLGGGRKSKGDDIDPAVGVVLHRRPGDSVAEGETLCEIHTNRSIDDSEALERAATAFDISRRRPPEAPLFVSS